jgi:archaellin
MDVKGSVIAIADSEGVSATVESLIFTVSNALGGKPVNLDNQIVDYDSLANTIYDGLSLEIGGRHV